MESVDPNKYIVFKREEFNGLLGIWMSRMGLDIELDERTMNEAHQAALPDAVVIRRQDLFAGPALHSYASSIAIASKLSDGQGRSALQPIADYFHEQAVLADDEGWKLPDL